jgi:hypothetical protein
LDLARITFPLESIRTAIWAFSNQVLHCDRTVLISSYFIVLYPSQSIPIQWLLRELSRLKLKLP